LTPEAVFPSVIQNWRVCQDLNKFGIMIQTNSLQGDGAMNQSRITNILSALVVLFVSMTILAGSSESDYKRVYLKYRKALEKGKDIQNVLPFLPDQAGSFLSELQPAAREEWFNRIFESRKEVQKVEVTNVQMEGDEAILLVRGNRIRDGKVGKGKVTMSPGKDGSLRVDRESWDFDWDVTFTPTEDRSLAKNDMAKGDFTVNGVTAHLTHAYVERVQDSFEPEYPALSVRLIDAPIAPDDYSIMEKVKEGALHYIDLTIDRHRMVNGAMLHHSGFTNNYISIAGTVDFTATRFGPVQIAGHVGMSEPAKSSFDDDTYYFSADFLATLWEISDRHLGTKPDGSFGVGDGKAVGTFTVDGKSFEFHHAYMKEYVNDEGKPEYACLVTDEKVDDKLLAEDTTLYDVLQMSGAHGLHVIIGADLEPYNWSWVHDDLKIGCYLCSDLKFNPEKVGKDRISGTLYSSLPQTFKEQSYEFKVTFSAVPFIPRMAERKPEIPKGANFFTDASPLKNLFLQGIGKPFNLIQLAIYPDYAILDAQDTGNRENFDRYSYLGGVLKDPEPLQTFTVTCKKGFDLKSVDFSVVPRLAEDAKKRLGIEGGKISHIILSRGVFCKSPMWSIYVMSRRKTGYVTYDLDGKHKKTYGM